MEIKTSEQLTKLIGSIVAKTLQTANRTTGNLIREGVVVATQADTSLISVKSITDNQVLTNLGYQFGVDQTTVYVGQPCLILSADPSNQSRNRVLLL